MPDTDTRWVFGTLAVLAGLILQQGAATNARIDDLRADIGNLRIDVRRLEDRLDRLRAVEVAFGKVEQPRDEGFKRDREHQELPESDDEEPGGDEETVGPRSEHNEHWLTPCRFGRAVDTARRAGWSGRTRCHRPRGVVLPVAGAAHHPRGCYHSARGGAPDGNSRAQSQLPTAT